MVLDYVDGDVVEAELLIRDFIKHYLPDLNQELMHVALANVPAFFSKFSGVLRDYSFGSAVAGALTQGYTLQKASELTGYSKSHLAQNRNKELDPITLQALSSIPEMTQGPAEQDGTITVKTPFEKLFSHPQSIVITPSPRTQPQTQRSGSGSRSGH